MALGQVDYGLLSVIGGLVVFIALIGNVLGGAVGRFYSFAIGEARAKEDGSGLENCQRWFNVACFLYTILPLILLAIGYPVGIYMINNCLNIPAERLMSCIWVYRWVCTSSFLVMLCVPFKAMYFAKQLIAELTVYSVLQTTFHTVILYYMTCHPGDWLSWTAFFMCVQVVVVDIFLAIRSVFKFPECRIRFAYMFDRKRIWQLASFAGWQFLGTLGIALRSQGTGILVNLYFTPVHNAALGVATTVSGRTQTFAAEVNAVFQPAIVSAFGSKDHDLSLKLVYWCSKFCSWSGQLLVLPLLLELPTLLRLWLGIPPPYTEGLCLCICLTIAIEQFTYGQLYALGAVAKIGLLQTLSFLFNALPLLLLWLLFNFGFSIYSLGAFLCITAICEGSVRILLAKKLANVPLGGWIKKVVLPQLLVSFMALSVSYLPHFYLRASLLRVVITTIIFIVSFIGLSLWLVITNEERDYLMSRLKRKFGRV